MKGITWIKGIFWVPWENLDTEVAIRSIIDKIEVGTGLIVAGVVAAAGTSLQTTRAEVNVLSSMIPDFALVIFPPSINECIHVVRTDATSTNGFVWHEV